MNPHAARGVAHEDHIHFRFVGPYQRFAGGRHDQEQPRVIIRAAKQVARPILFALAIIIISFVPVFLLEAQEGRMFRPGLHEDVRDDLRLAAVDHVGPGADDHLHPR